MRRLHNEGPEAFVQIREPFSRFPGFVGYLVRRLGTSVPLDGKPLDSPRPRTSRTSPRRDDRQADAHSGAEAQPLAVLLVAGRRRRQLPPARDGGGRSPEVTVPRRVTQPRAGRRAPMRLVDCHLLSSDPRTFSRVFGLRDFSRTAASWQPEVIAS